MSNNYTEIRFSAGTMDVIIYTGTNKTPNVVIGSKGFSIEGNDFCFLVPNDQVSELIAALQLVEKTIY